MARLLEAARVEVTGCIEANRHVVEALRDALLEHDELVGDEIAAVIHAAVGSVRLDIPRFQMSSRGGEFVVAAVSPGDVLVVGGVVGEAAVEDADEAVSEGS